jgi:Holliday junction DNA helicase RuvA
MIGHLQGQLSAKTPPQIVLDCQGVGYEVDVPMSTFYNLPNVGQTIRLLTHLVVREDAHLLYGFGTEAERALFRQLIKISGIGPRMALGLLSGMSVTDVAQAVALQEVSRFVKVPGIGKKTAERLLLELKGKLSTDLGHSVGSISSGGGAHQDVLQALLALGYSEKEASLAVRQLPADVSVSAGIKTALRALS